VLVGELLPRVEELARRVRSLSQPGAVEQVSVDLQLGPLRVIGAVGPVQGGRRLLADWGRLRERQVVRRWVEHLALCAMGGGAETVLVGRGPRVGAEVRRLRPSERARGWLEELALLWLEGRRRPLPFFPEASAAYARLLRERGDDRAAMQAARRAFGGGQPYDEAEDASVLRCFGADPLEAPAFRGLAQAVYAPLLECLEGP
jgi:exodeoxyribonuclease V gamma subunit